MKKKKYPITREAEKQLAYAECTDPRFHELLGHAIEYDRLPNDDCQNLVWAAQEIARNNEWPCASTVAAVQQLRLKVNAGKLTHEALQEASDLLDSVEDGGGISDLDGLIATVAPAIRSLASEDALETTIQQMATGIDAAEAADRFAAVAQMGRAKVSRGTALAFTAAMIAAAAQSTITDPLPTGIPDLDSELGGGVERASLACFLANSGDGKSMAMCHVASEAIWEGRKVAYVTAELSEMQIIQRVMCNVMNMTPQELSDNPTEAVMRRCQLDSHQRVQSSTGRPVFSLGDLRVLYVSPKVGTVAQIRQWLKDLARDSFEPELLVVDYADKLAAKAGIEARSTYQEQGAVYQQLRDLAVDLGIWCWTASQTTGRAGRKKKLDIEDISDSMEKARIVDTLVAIIRGEEDVQGNTVRFYLPKRRNGAAHKNVGPCNMDAEHWRMVSITRNWSWG